MRPPNVPGFETRAIHAGQDPDPVTGAVVPPISLSTTFAQSAPGEHGGYEYARSGNPTRSALETCLASLEGAPHGLAFASGLAAEDTLLRTLPSGARLVVGNDAYGGTYRLIARVHSEQRGLAHTAVDLTDLDALDAALEGSEVAAVWLETPTNPRLDVIDIEAVAQRAHGAGALCVVDNTFATPYLQNPIAFGADVVVHSTTKYIGGHSDVVGGFLAVAPGRDELADQLRFLQNAAGSVPGPLDCYLLLRGIKTLGVRMDRHCTNAAAVADHLAGRSEVGRVLYPGLLDHPGHALATRQMRGFGGMVSFIATGGEQAALEIAKRTELFTLAESLGAVESLLCHPARMTHASAAGSALEVDPALIRLSVGLESLPDLLTDLDQALS